MGKLNSSLIRKEDISIEELGDLYGERKKNTMEFEEEVQKRGAKVITNIKTTLLRKNEANHFRPIEGDAWTEFVESIKQAGILTPLIVRKLEDETYRIIAGHNRLRAAEEIGLEEVPAIVMDVDDIDETVIIGVTNKQRENISDIEWGWTYRTTYEAMKKAVGRPKEDVEQKCSQRGNISEKSQRTVEIVANKYGVGKNTVLRKLRLTYVEPKFYEYLKKKNTPQDVIVELSYLKPDEQINLGAELGNKKIDLELAKNLRELSENGFADVDRIGSTIDRHFSKNKVERSDKPIKVKVDDNLLPREMSNSEKEIYVNKALAYIKENGISL